MVGLIFPTFPSPCGDELIQQRTNVMKRSELFPSPCGDELIQIDALVLWVLHEFPSPCGDELIPAALEMIANLQSFRPLAGMS